MSEQASTPEPPEESMDVPANAARLSRISGGLIALREGALVAIRFGARVFLLSVVKRPGIGIGRDIVRIQSGGSSLSDLRRSSPRR